MKHFELKGLKMWEQELQTDDKNLHKVGQSGTGNSSSENHEQNDQFSLNFS